MTKPNKIEWSTVAFMAVVHALAVVALLPSNWSWGGLIALLLLYWVTACLGVTIGYHRLLSHRSFFVPQWLERFFATCGALSAQYGPIDWVGLHRQHHKFADTDRDPHDSTKGFWHCHMGWMLHKVPGQANTRAFTKDLKDPYYEWLNTHFLWLNVALGVGLFALGGWSYVLWGIFLRLTLVYHVTWLVNSATHFWGKRAFETPDDALNNPWVASVTWGEGWHNNHHAFPRSARQGFGGQIDLTWLHITAMKALGLAKKVVIADVTVGEVAQ